MKHFFFRSTPVNQLLLGPYLLLFVLLSVAGFFVIRDTKRIIEMYGYIADTSNRKLELLNSILHIDDHTQLVLLKSIIAGDSVALKNAEEIIDQEALKNDKNWDEYYRLQKSKEEETLIKKVFATKVANIEVRNELIRLRLTPTPISALANEINAEEKVFEKHQNTITSLSDFVIHDTNQNHEQADLISLAAGRRVSILIEITILLLGFLGVMIVRTINTIRNQNNELKVHEQKLKESLEKFSSIFEASNDGIMLLNETGFFDCNPRTLELFKISSKEEFIKLHPADLSPPS
jgi:PAS domain-containing protein